MRKIVQSIFILALFLAACDTNRTINFNQDPSILRGQWIGEILPTVRFHELLGVDASGTTLFALQDNQSRSDNRMLWLRASDGEVIRENSIQLPDRYGRIFTVRPDGSLWYATSRAFDQPPALYIYAPDGTQKPVWGVDPVQLSGDGTHLMARETPTRYAIYEVDTRQKLRDFVIPENFSYDIFGNHPPRLDAISPDLQSVVSSKVVRYGLGMQIEVYLYDLDLNQKYTLVCDRIGPIGSGRFGIPGLFFSPDGSRLIGLMPDQRVYTWRASDGVEMSEEFIERVPGSLVAMSPDARRRVYLEVSNGNKYRSYTFHWWEAGRGFYSKQIVQDIWRGAEVSITSNVETIWLSSWSGLFAHYGAEGAIWRKAPEKIPLQLNLNAILQNEREYSLSGTAAIAGQNYTLTGQASVIYGKLTQALPPPQTKLSMSMQDDQGNKRYLVGYGQRGKGFYQLAYSAEEISPEPSGDLPGRSASVWIGEIERP